MDEGLHTLTYTHIHSHTLTYTLMLFLVNNSTSDKRDAVNNFIKDMDSEIKTSKAGQLAIKDIKDYLEMIEALE